MAVLNIIDAHTSAPGLQRILLRSPPPKKHLKLLFNLINGVPTRCLMDGFTWAFWITHTENELEEWEIRDHFAVKNQFLLSLVCAKYVNELWDWNYYLLPPEVRLIKWTLIGDFATHLSRKMWANGGKKSRTEFFKLD